VKLYTRPTITRKAIGWEGRAVLHELLCVVDRAGCIDLGEEEDHLDALAVLLDMPREVVDAGLVRLIKRGTVEVRGNVLLLPKFLDAQRARQSDKARQRTSREARRALALAAQRGVLPKSALSQTVTDDDLSHDVTEEHETGHVSPKTGHDRSVASQPVTPRSDEIRSEENKGDTAIAVTPSSARKDAAPPSPQSKVRTELYRRLYLLWDAARKVLAVDWVPVTPPPHELLPGELMEPQGRHLLECLNKFNPTDEQLLIAADYLEAHEHWQDRGGQGVMLSFLVRPPGDHFSELLHKSKAWHEHKRRPSTGPKTGNVPAGRVAPSAPAFGGSVSPDDLRSYLEREERPSCSAPQDRPQPGQSEKV